QCDGELCPCRPARSGENPGARQSDPRPARTWPVRACRDRSRGGFMTTAVAAAPGREGSAARILLVAGITIAALTEAVASTALSLGRGDLIGDTHATPDEFAWLDIGYTALKMIGFMTAPWLVDRINPRTLVVGATLVMGMACAA